MKKIKIIICSTAHRYDDSRIFHRQALTLSKHFDVKLFICAPFKSKQINDGLIIVGLPIWKHRIDRIKSNVLLWSYLRKENADVYIFHDPELLLTIPFVKLFKKARIIYDIHEYYHEHLKEITWLPKWLAINISRMYRILENFSLKYIDMIWFPVEKVIEHHSNYNNQNSIKKLEVRNFPILNLFNEERNDTGLRLNQILYVGVMTEDRNFEMLIHAFSKFAQEFPQFKFLLAGNFYSETYKNKLINLINELAMNERVKLLGRVSYAEVPKLMRQSKIGMLVLPPLFNFENSMPNKLFEYMAAGLPVIASNFENFRRVIETENCGICVDPLNVEEITNAMKALIKDEAKRQVMGQSGKSAVLKKYNWEQEGELMVNETKSLFPDKIPSENSHRFSD